MSAARTTSFDFPFSLVFVAALDFLIEERSTKAFLIDPKPDNIPRMSTPKYIIRANMCDEASAQALEVEVETIGWLLESLEGFNLNEIRISVGIGIRLTR